MRENHESESISAQEKVIEWPGIKERIKEISELEEKDGEPFFFMIENESEDREISPLFRGKAESIKMPIPVLLEYLIPGFSSMERTGNTEALVVAKILTVKGIAHFPPKWCHRTFN